MKKTAAGVRGIRLSKGDGVKEVYLLNLLDDTVVKVSGKKVVLADLKTTARGGKGSKK